MSSLTQADKDRLVRVARQFRSRESKRFVEKYLAIQNAWAVTFDLIDKSKEINEKQSVAVLCMIVGEFFRNKAVV